MSRLTKFIGRHIGPSSKDISSMLKVIGYSNIDTFVRHIVPANILLDKGLDNIPKVLQQ